MMTKYRMFYYVILVAVFASVLMILGLNLNLFNTYNSEDFFWFSFFLFMIIEWLEKKENFSKVKKENRK